jgi:GNAT superfamily N-acetyltransferase
MCETVTIRPAGEHEVPVILDFIRALAKYERLEHELVATEEGLRKALFGARPYAEVVFACVGTQPERSGGNPEKRQWGDAGQPVGFALFFHNFSTFLGRPGIYLEDLFVHPEARGRGIGKRLLQWLANTAVERGCGRLEWSVLDWNEPSIAFYRSLGAVAMDEWSIFRLTGAALTSLAAQDNNKR